MLPGVSKAQKLMAEPKITAKNTKALILILSMTAPEKIEAVVQANKVNAATNTPVAWSLSIGPI